jgi:hypothetical protein
MTPIDVALIAAALTLLAGGGHIAGTGNGGRITIVVISAALLALSLFFVVQRLIH